MIPGIDIRIISLIKSIEDVILPALPNHSFLAKEQAAIAIGQLNLLQQQWRYVSAYEAMRIKDSAGFARALLREVKGGRLTQMAIKKLKKRLEIEVSDEEENENNVDEALCELITALHIDGEREAKEQASHIILTYSRKHAQRDRAWFAAAGIDPDAAQLTPIPRLVKAKLEGLN